MRVKPLIAPPRSGCPGFGWHADALVDILPQALRCLAEREQIVFNADRLPPVVVRLGGVVVILVSGAVHSQLTRLKGRGERATQSQYCMRYMAPVGIHRRNAQNVGNGGHRIEDALRAFA